VNPAFLLEAARLYSINRFKIPFKARQPFIPSETAFTSARNCSKKIISPFFSKPFQKKGQEK